jgi:hypothetical protein
MWYQLGLFGSRVVEEVSIVSEDKDAEAGTHHEVTVVEAVVGADSAEEPEEDRAYGEHVRSKGASCEKVTVVEAAVVADSAEEPEEDRAYGEHVRMDASALIGKRMGIDQGEVESKLVQLHRKGELDGTAGLPSQPAPDAYSDADEDNGDISLTSKVLEDFEKAEAEAKVNRSQTGTPYKLTFKPAVLGDPATPSAPATSAAPSAMPAPSAGPSAMPAPSAPSGNSATPAPSASPASAQFVPSAEMQEGSKVDMAPEPDAESTPDSQPAPSTSSKWCDESMEVLAEEVKEVKESDVCPERRRYGEAVEAENIYGSIAAIEVPLLDSPLVVGDLQLVVQEVVGQVNVAHKALATAGYVVAERSREALHQARISSDLATESLLKAYEVAAVAASSARQSWKMCIQLSGPDMPLRSKDAERKPETTGRYLATTLFGVTQRPEEVAISHFRGPHSNEFIMKFTRELSRRPATCK